MTERQRRLVTWLRGLVPRLPDAEAARVLAEIGEQLAGAGAPQEALETTRQAFLRHSRDVFVARAYRCAALRVGASEDVLAAIEGEARNARASTRRSLLEMERGLALEVDRPAAARVAYLRALDGGAVNLVALEGLERLARRERAFGEAQGYASRLAGATWEPAVRAEHLARAAGYALEAGQIDEALSLAAHAASGDGPVSPLVAVRAEAVAIAAGRYEDVVALRERAIHTGEVGTGEGWFDVGLMARYRLGDGDRAREAFERASAACDAAADRDACDRELLPIYERQGRWDEVVGCAERRLGVDQDPMHRAHLLSRIAGARLRQGDESGALAAFGQALEQDPTYGPALEGAGRIYQSRGDVVRLVAMHQVEAETAPTERDRGLALRRAGEVLIQDEATRAEGIRLLQSALAALPGDLGTFGALERALRRERRWGELRDLYEAEIARGDEPARRGWLNALLALLTTEQLGDRARALQALREMEGLPVAHPPAPLLRLARLFEDQDDLDALAEVLARQAEQTAAPALRASLLTRLAEVHERRGAETAAVASHREAVAVAPPSHGAFGAAGRAFLRMERYEELSALLEEGASPGVGERDRARWLEKAARVLEMQLGRVDDAVVALSRALALLPEDPEMSMALEDLLARHERWERLEPVAEGPSLWRGGLAEAVGRDDRALACYRQALAEGSTMARLPYRRALLAERRWDELERHVTSSASGYATSAAHLWAAHGAAARGDRDAATRHAIDAHAAKPEPAAALALAQWWGPELPATALPVMSVLVEAMDDPGVGIAALRRIVVSLARLGRDDEAHRRRLALLERAPADPIALPAVEVALEASGDRATLVALLRAALAEDALEPEYRAALAVKLGAVLESSGRRRDALDVFEAATMVDPAHRTALVARARLAASLGDDTRRGAALEALAALPPDGPERTLCWRARQGEKTLRGEDGGADGPFGGPALHAPGNDVAARAALRDGLRQGDAEAYLEALTRGFERATADREHGRLAPIGAALAAELLRRGRTDRAHVVCERVQSDCPDDLSISMLAAVTHEYRFAFDRSVGALLRVVRHPEVAADVALEAWRRIAWFSVRRLHDRDGARRALAAMNEIVDDQDDRNAVARLEVEMLLEDWNAAAQTLAVLAASETRDSDERAEDWLQLAILRERMGDPKGAMGALANVDTPARRRDAVERLFGLAVRSQRWREAVEALDTVLERPFDIDWVRAMRQRLAHIFREELDDEAGAQDQEAKRAKLRAARPGRDAVGVGAEALLLTDADRTRALAEQRARLERYPSQTEGYRAVRALADQLGEEVTAFRAEAVLVGLGEATEEERASYTRRRARFTAVPQMALDDTMCEFLYPDLADAGAQLLVALDAAWPRILGVDSGGYRVHPDAAPASLVTEVARVARVLGVDGYRLVITAAEASLAVDFDRDDDPLLLVPPSLADALPAEQAFVLGAMFATVRFGGIAIGPSRHRALDHDALGALLEGAAALAQRSPVSAGTAAATVHDRLRNELSTPVRLELEDLGPALSLPLDGARMRRRLSIAAVRAGMLCAADPAVAVRALRTHHRLFGPVGDRGLPEVGWAGLPFAVSAPFAVMVPGPREGRH